MGDGNNSEIQPIACLLGATQLADIVLHFVACFLTYNLASVETRQMKNGKTERHRGRKHIYIFLIPEKKEKKPSLDFLANKRSLGKKKKIRKQFPSSLSGKSWFLTFHILEMSE